MRIASEHGLQLHHIAPELPFRVIARNGHAPRYRKWRDTVMTRPRETVGVAFVADNPGDRMFRCHFAEHPARGMTGIVRVA